MFKTTQHKVGWYDPYHYCVGVEVHNDTVAFTTLLGYHLGLLQLLQFKVGSTTVACGLIGLAINVDVDLLLVFQRLLM